MKIKLQLLDGHYIIIDVYKENKIWFDFFQERRKSNQYNPFLATDKICHFDNHSYNQLAWNAIVENTEYLKSQNFKLPYELPAEFNYDQKLLNVIHRFFTYNSTWALAYCESDMTGNTTLTNPEPNPFDSSFIPSDLKQFLTTISNLNVAVHELEPSCMTPNKQTILDIIKGDITRRVTIDNYQYTSNGWLNIDHQLDEFQKSYLNTYPNVIMSEEIQGKSYLRAFIDNDDPTKLDVTGRYGSYGGFIIDTNNHRKTIYESTEFNDWLASYGLKKENLLLCWPLGQVIETSLETNQDFPNHHIDIQFIED
jgi:hypothetical protein